MGKQEQNVSIYLRKELYEILKELSTLTSQPISRIIQSALNEPTFLATLKGLIDIVKEMKAKQENEKGGEIAPNGEQI